MWFNGDDENATSTPFAATEPHNRKQKQSSKSRLINALHPHHNTAFNNTLLASFPLSVYTQHHTSTTNTNCITTIDMATMNNITDSIIQQQAMVMTSVSHPSDQNDNEDTKVTTTTIQAETTTAASVAVTTMKPIERRVKFVFTTTTTESSSAAATNHSPNDDHHDCNNSQQEGNGKSNSSIFNNNSCTENNIDDDEDVITLTLDEDEERLLDALHNAAKAWEDGRIVIPQQQQQSPPVPTTSTSPATTTIAPAIAIPPPPSTRGVQVRIAGGWVRDRILGLQTHDVDIALDTCTGVEFATILKSYIEQNEVVPVVNNDDDDNNRGKQQQQEQQQLEVVEEETAVVVGGGGDNSSKMQVEPRDEAAGRRITTAHAATTTTTDDDVTNHKTTTKKKKTKKKTSSVGRIGVIAANPDQSKHLETATMRVFGIDVDFANLRHEKYGDDSRIPHVGMGSPLEDAYRRDFTMNSLFLNLHTGRIEDWTGRGLQDLLQTKIVETPLEAYRTFQDDPLRALRAVRFAVRYQMKLADDLVQACRHEHIHLALQRKVSRERVGKELEGMLSGKHSYPIHALDMICSVKLGGSVFCLPPPSSMAVSGAIGQRFLCQVPYVGSTIETQKEDLAHFRSIAWEEGCECLHVLPLIMDALQINSHRRGDGISNLAKRNSRTTITPMDKRLVYLATVLLPFQNLIYMEKPTKYKPIVEYIMRESIKFKSKDVTSMVTIMYGLDDMVQLLQSRPPQATTATATATTIASPTRLQCGLLLRTTKDMWVTTLIVATISLIRRRSVVHPASTADTTATTTTTTTATTTHDDKETPAWWCQRAVDWYRTIVNEMDLDGSWLDKPIMNGQELINFLGLDRGPEVGQYTQEQIRWVLMNPKGTIEELKLYLKSYQKERNEGEVHPTQPVSKKMHL